MNSIHHAVLSALVSLGAVAVLEPAAPLVLVAAGIVAGTAIDVDHFPISRVRAGDWRAVDRTWRNPLLVVTEPAQLFAGGRVHPLERLLSHVLLAGVATVTSWLLWPALGVVVGASLYVHLVADLIWDVRELHRRPR